MRTYILRRVAATLPVLVGVATVVFLALRLIPGDPAIALAGEKASAAEVEHLREQLGLNRPLPVQYVEFLTHTFTLQLGRSIRTGGDVSTELATNFAPTIELSTITMAIVSRMSRSSMLEVLSSDYLTTARAKGLRESTIVLRHALKNALIPVVTVIGLQLGALLSGAVLTETVFGRVGVGRYVLNAITARDYPVVQATVIVVALFVVVISLIVDLVYAILDPRIRYA